VALENALENAKRLIEVGAVDDDDIDDGLELVGRYTELQGVIGEPPMIESPPE
jgi:hypothetical protein